MARKRLAAVFVLSCGLSAVAETQAVRGYYFWVDNETQATPSTDCFSPKTFFVDGQSPTGQFSAVLGYGLKVESWWRQLGLSLSTREFELVQSGGDFLTWVLNSKLGSTVYIGLKQTYISYQLTYEGGTTAALLYTNRHAVADCTFSRTGYVFGDAWTNAVGTSFDVGKPVTGASFGITNHDDTATVNLYPKWTANAYSVRFNATEGTGTMSAQDFVYDEQKALTSNAFTRTGHTFAGWAMSAGGTVRYADGENVRNLASAAGAVVDLYAVWTVNTFSLAVSADENGSASKNPSADSYAYGTEVVLTATPRDQGSVFEQWSDGVAENPRTVIVTSNAVYVAKFRKNKYLVTWKDAPLFDSVVLKTEEVDWGADATPPDDPEQTGYSFTGWSQDWHGITSKKTIVAQYEANGYRVWFDKNDGSAAPTRISQTFTYDTPGTLKANEYTRNGYTFLGWGTNRSDMVEVYADGAAVLNWRTEGSMDLYAVWKANSYTVHFDPGKGSGTMNDQSFVFDQAQALSSNRFVNGELAFLGWNGDNGGKYDDGQVVSNLTSAVDGTVILTARWADTYHVAFDGNGATSGEMAPQMFKDVADQQNLTSNAYAKTGYAFVGWATNRADAAAHRIFKTDGASVKGLAEPGETLTLYASWQPITYYVAFSAGEGVTVKELDVLTCTYDQAFQLPVATNGNYRAHDPELYAFGGWTNRLQGVRYGDQAIVSNLCTTVGATNTLVAVWTLDAGDWSRHMHCDSLKWELMQGSRSIGWIQNEGPTYGCTNTGMSVSQDDGPWDSKKWLQTSVKTNGMLRFSCRWVQMTSSPASRTLCIGLVEDEENVDFHDNLRFPSLVSEFSPFYSNVELPSNDEWVTVNLEIPLGANTGKTVMRLASRTSGNGGYVEVDQVVWTPEGGAGPVPGPSDAPTVTGVSLESGKIVIRSSGNAKFGYQVLSTSSLSPVDWKVEGESYQAGSGEGQQFELPVDSTHPQKFYKVEVLQKQ